MTDGTDASEGWFADVDPDDVEAAAAAVADGTAETPGDWPALAVEAGFADSEDAYYEALHEATTRATREAVQRRERADDSQLVHAVRAMDDVARVANELAERAAEWAGSLFDDAGADVAAMRALADQVTPETAAELRAVSLAERVADLDDERAELREYVERHAPTVAPNLSMLAGPVLAARLVALAGGLEALAKMPSGTVQVLGAEDALFAHLRGNAPSPKHGVIFTHEYVRGTARSERGSAARALAGKLAIAARIDHYAGDRRSELADELDARIARIRNRGGGA